MDNAFHQILEMMMRNKNSNSPLEGSLFELQSEHRDLSTDYFQITYGCSDISVLENVFLDPEHKHNEIFGSILFPYVYKIQFFDSTYSTMPIYGDHVDQ